MTAKCGVCAKNAKPRKKKQPGSAASYTEGRRGWRQEREQTQEELRNGKRKYGR